jgi:membrane associated rhomboid family serine protease
VALRPRRRVARGAPSDTGVRPPISAGVFVFGAKVSVVTRLTNKRDWKQLKITRGALVLLVIQLVVTIAYLVLQDQQQAFKDYVVLTPRNLFEHGRVWTIVTSPFLELNFVSLVLGLLMLWMFIPTLERFWGTARFYRFVAATSVAAGIVGCAMGWVTGHVDEPIQGFSPFIYAAVVAFGVIYAKQQIAFSFYIRMTGRQFMWGMLVFVALFCVIQQFWELFAAYGAAIGVAAMIVSKRWSPGLVWKRWRIARARAKLSVIEGGARLAARPPAKKRPTDEQRFLN